jgi:hypothetical protein
MFLDGMRTGSLGAGTLNSVARTENKSNNVARGEENKKKTLEFIGASDQSCPFAGEK